MPPDVGCVSGRTLGRRRGRPVPAERVGGWVGYEASSSRLLEVMASHYYEALGDFDLALAHMQSQRVSRGPRNPLDYRSL